MQVSYRGSVLLCIHSFELLFICTVKSIYHYSFLKDFQPHSDIDAGAHHGQFDLSSDQEMWPELHVSARRQRTRRNWPPTVLKENKIFSFFFFFYHFMPFPSCCMTRPLKRMTVGMVLAAIAFICAALVQLEIDVSRKVIHYIRCPHSWAEKISC